MNLTLNRKQQAALDWAVENHNAEHLDAGNLSAEDYLQVVVNDFVRQHAKARRDKAVERLAQADASTQEHLLTQLEAGLED